MTALIIGGDNLGGIQYKLRDKGFDNIQHITGRKGWDKKIGAQLKSVDINVIIILVDYVNHSVVNNTKKILKNLDVKTIYSKRSWVHLENYIDDFVGINRI